MRYHRNEIKSNKSLYVKLYTVCLFPYGEASVQPIGAAVLVLRPVAEARCWGADVLVGPLPGKDPLIQAAGGQDVLLIHPAQRCTGEHSSSTLTSCYAVL